MRYTRAFYQGQAGSDMAFEAQRRYLAEHGGDAWVPDAEVLLRRLEQYDLAIPPSIAFVRRYLEKYRDKVFVVRNSTERGRLLEWLKSSHGG